MKYLRVNIVVKLHIPIKKLKVFLIIFELGEEIYEKISVFMNG